MDKFLRIAACAGNVLAVVFLLRVWSQEEIQGTDLLLFCLLLALPVLNLVVIWQDPDLEERRLRRQLAKAELRERLKQLGQ